jgi:H+/Cl- antiporter ClcA
VRRPEETHDINVLIPLLVAVILAHGTTVLLLKRSILTEKVARRGFHLTRQLSEGNHSFSINSTVSTRAPAGQMEAILI